MMRPNDFKGFHLNLLEIEQGLPTAKRFSTYRKTRVH
jgi:hypothetical protein